MIELICFFSFESGYRVALSYAVCRVPTFEISRKPTTK